MNAFFKYIDKSGNLAEINKYIILQIYLILIGIRFIFPINSRRNESIF